MFAAPARLRELLPELEPGDGLALAESV